MAQVPVPEKSRVSAFTPYKPGFSPTHPEFSSMLTMYAAAMYSLGIRQQVQQPKGSAFLIKNILKEETRENTGERTVPQDAGRLEVLVSSLGKSDSGHKCIYCGKMYSRKYGLKIHIR